ncbi:MAG: glycosyltransferase, partial [Acidobacteriota bacterium]
VIGANVLLFSVLGGALLTRYLLPLYPLVLLLCVNTFRRRLRDWYALVVLSAAAFVAGLFINPPYRFAPEDNLEYATVIRLHQAAVREIVEQMPGATVLTAWPASDELTKPELGYIAKPMRVVTIDNFSAPEIARVGSGPREYSAALVFSTKYDPPHLWLGLRRWNEKFDTKYFDFHHDLPPGMIARVLGGQVIWGEARKGQWIAVLRFGAEPGARTASVADERQPARATNSATPAVSR